MERALRYRSVSTLPGAQPLAKQEPQGGRTQSGGGKGLRRKSTRTHLGSRTADAPMGHGAVVAKSQMTQLQQMSGQATRSAGIRHSVPSLIALQRPEGKRSGGLRPTPTNSPSVPRVLGVRGPTMRAALIAGRRSSHLRPKCALGFHTSFGAVACAREDPRKAGIFKF